MKSYQQINEFYHVYLSSFLSTDPKTMASSGKLVALWKQGLNEIPEVILAGVAATVMATAAAFKLQYDKKNDKFNKVYKFQPVYMRPDDPRVAKVHKP